MKKYYTLERAVKKAYQDQKIFELDKELPTCRNYKNLIRMFFGYNPKMYYFNKPLKNKERQRYEQKILESRLKLTRDDYNEIDNNYRW